MLLPAPCISLRFHFVLSLPTSPSSSWQMQAVKRGCHTGHNPDLFPPYLYQDRGFFPIAHTEIHMMLGRRLDDNPVRILMLPQAHLCGKRPQESMIGYVQRNHTKFSTQNWALHLAFSFSETVLRTAAGNVTAIGPCKPPAPSLLKSCAEGRPLCMRNILLGQVGLPKQTVCVSVSQAVGGDRLFSVSVLPDVLCPILMAGSS
jgi:hypothetical protein